MQANNISSYEDCIEKLKSVHLELKNISSMVISNSFHLYLISFITSLVTTYFAFEFL